MFVIVLKWFIRFLITSIIVIAIIGLATGKLSGQTASKEELHHKDTIQK